MSEIEKKLNSINNKQIVFSDYPEFEPDFTPHQMIELGVFGGSYYNHQEHYELKNCYNDMEFLNIIEDLSGDELIYIDKVKNKYYDKKINLFKVKCGSEYYQWLENGWIKTDQYGWFHWYYNFFKGRRLGNEDYFQIKRWSSFKSRHFGMLLSRCALHDLNSCLKTRQNLLHWAIDSTKI